MEIRPDHYGKPINEVNSHRPIGLLPTPSKLFEKLLSPE
jgi:hypothetical protein